MTDKEYEQTLELVTSIATGIAMEDSKLLNSEDHFHDTVFGQVIGHIDRWKPELQHIESKEISEVCSEVESDILHGDILGDFRETSGVGWPD